MHAPPTTYLVRGKWWVYADSKKLQCYIIEVDNGDRSPNQLLNFKVNNHEQIQK